MGKGANNKSSGCGFSNSLTKVWIANNLDRPFDGGGSAGVGPTGSNSGGANEVLVGHTIHRDEYASSSSSSPSPRLDAQNSANKSSGEMVPIFTNSQLIELERQAMIYKYMVTSVPVPPHLLHPTYGRCKRTDGKKWRCSRDVAPHQKYCERHLHRGRPRSRKPVEININNNQNNGHEIPKKPRLKQTPDLSTISTIPSQWENNNIRDPGLMMMENEMVAMNGAFLELSNMGFANDNRFSIYGSSPIFHQDYMDHQHVLSYLNYPQAPVGLIGQNMNIELMDHESFNDPWLNRSIAMADGNVLDEEMGSVRASDVASFCDEGAGWLSPVYWEQFGPGGPLAEAFLRNPASPHYSISGPTTIAVSSPSGIIPMMLFSNSDSSVCNSWHLG
ncbi:hypothetical protein CASFOL_023730 [Castilleja foliolosa]|uniref:Growth-regulating factor n=1 Tax=Castilleja foliolosa TaxID=1961234 RepID=A0ABD3CPA3_9LAMI